MTFYAVEQIDRKEQHISFNLCSKHTSRSN
jgi:hypothetical protein